MRMSEWLDQDNLSRKEGDCPVGGYPYGFMDDGAKKDIRRSILKAVAIPGYQVPYGSREMPIARGWGTGGIQITLQGGGETAATAKELARQVIMEINNLNRRKRAA